MLRSALSKQEKSVDNLPLDCPLVGFWGGVVGVMDGVRELFVRFAMRRDWLRRCRCFAQCHPGLRAGVFQSAQRNGLGPIKKSSDLPKPAWMLRSALSKQEKSVDNLPRDCPLVGFWGGVVGVMDGVRELFAAKIGRASCRERV